LDIWQSTAKALNRNVENVEKTTTSKTNAPTHSNVWGVETHTQRGIKNAASTKKWGKS